MFERSAHDASGMSSTAGPAAEEEVLRRSPRRGPPTASFEPSAVLRVGFYATSFGVNFPQKAAACAASDVVIQMVPGLATAPADGAGVDLRHATPATDAACFSLTYRALHPPLSEAFAALREMAAAGCGLRIVSMHWGHEFEGASPCSRRLHAADAAALQATQP